MKTTCNKISPVFLRRSVTCKYRAKVKYKGLNLSAIGRTTLEAKKLLTELVSYVKTRKTNEVTAYDMDDKPKRLRVFGLGPNVVEVGGLTSDVASIRFPRNRVKFS